MNAMTSEGSSRGDKREASDCAEEEEAQRAAWHAESNNAKVAPAAPKLLLKALIGGSCRGSQAGNDLKQLNDAIFDKDEAKQEESLKAFFTFKGHEVIVKAMSCNMGSTEAQDCGCLQLLANAARLNQDKEMTIKLCGCC